MLISNRRFRWGLVLCLLVGVGFVVRPIRTWLDQAAVQSIDPSLYVQSVQYYPKESIVEMKGFQWSNRTEQCEWGFRANKAWFVLETEPLTERRFVCSKGTLEKPVLYFTPLLPTKTKTTRQSSADYIGGTTSGLAVRSGAVVADLDLTTLEYQFQDLLDAEGIKQALRLQVDDWMNQSRRIREQVQRLANSDEWGNNPLRHEEELRVRLERLEALATQQQQILAEIEESRDHVSGHCEQLLAQLAEQIRLSANAKGQSKGTESQIANGILTQIAMAKWTELRDFAWASQAVAGGMPNHTQREYDHFYYDDVESEALFFQARNLSAHGLFVPRMVSGREEVKFPFRVDAALRLANDNMAQIESSWQYCFSTTDSLVALVAESDTQNTAQLELVELPGYASEASASDHSDASEQKLPAGKALLQRPDFRARLVATAAAGKVDGKMEMQTSRIDSEETWAKIFHAATQSSGEDIWQFAVAIQGDWTAPEIKVEGEIPEWMTKALESEQNTIVQREHDAAHSDLKSRFQYRVDQLQSSVGASLDSGRAIVEKQYSVLRVAKASMQKQLDEITGDAFTADRSMRASPIR